MAGFEPRVLARGIGRGPSPQKNGIAAAAFSCAYAIGLGLFATGLGLVLYSTILIDHFELFGLRQVFEHLMRKPSPDDDFVTPSLYRYVRHPLYVGWFITLWATPSMSVGHFLFASVCTSYILVAAQLEERDLVAAFGKRYAMYQETTPMFLPGFAAKPNASSALNIG